MAKTPSASLARLWGRVRDVTDTESETDRITTSYLNRLIWAANYRLLELLPLESLRLASFEFTTSASASQFYQLPTLFYKESAVSIYPDSGDQTQRPIRHLNWEEFLEDHEPRSWEYGAHVGYKINYGDQGGATPGSFATNAPSIGFSPLPNAAFRVKVYFVGRPRSLTASTSATASGEYVESYGHPDFLVYHAAQEVAIKNEDSNADAIAAKLGYENERVRQEHRHGTKPVYVVDHKSNYRGPTQHGIRWRRWRW